MIINFDNAATTFPKPASVRSAVNHAVTHYGGNAGRGGHPLAAASSEAVYSARETAAEFFGAQPENVVFTSNCTHALNLAIHGVMSGGGHIIISGMEHNSSARPAAKLAAEGRISLSVAPVYPEDERTIESFRRLIRRDTKAIVCTIAGNVTGQLMPYRELGKLCQERGICFIADGAQACGVVDVKLGHGINILCTAGHKGLYGISGSGLLVTDSKFPIPSLMQGGTGTESKSLVHPELLPESLESGTLGIPGIMSVKAGIEFVNRIGIDRIYAHENAVCNRFMRELSRDPRVTIYRSSPANYVPIVSFNIAGVSSESAAGQLAERGYCLRAGFHCSALAHAQLGTDTGTVRFSPSVFSRESDAVSLAGAISHIK